MEGRVRSRTKMTGILHSRLFQAGAAAVLAVIFLALGYLGTRGQPPTRDSPFEQLRIAIPMVPHPALLYSAAAKGHFAKEGLAVTRTPPIHVNPAAKRVVHGKADRWAQRQVNGL